MRPTHIPETDVWNDAVLVEVGPPADMTESVMPVRCVQDIVHVAESGRLIPAVRYNMKIKLTKEDLAHLQEDGTFWLSMLGGIVPFQIGLLPEGIVPTPIAVDSTDCDSDDCTIHPLTPTKE